MRQRVSLVAPSRPLGHDNWNAFASLEDCDDLINSLILKSLQGWLQQVDLLVDVGDQPEFHLAGAISI